MDIGEFVDARVAEGPNDPLIQACGMAPGFARKPVMGDGAEDALLRFVAGIWCDHPDYREEWRLP